MADAAPDVRDFERRVRDSQRLVYQIAFGVLANAADAEEVAQDVFLRAYRRLDRLREPENFRAWVCRVSWRLALNRLRSSTRALRRDGAWLAARTPGELDPADQEFQMRVEREIARLPEKLRAVLMLSAVEGLDARAVATVLNIPEGTVRSRLHNARRKIRDALWP